MRLVAEPRIEASGVRKSCEIEASSVLRTRSVSAALRAATISRASEARSSAAAVCSASVSSSVRASAIQPGTRFIAAEADHAEGRAARLQRQEEPRHRGQRRRIGARRLVVLERPARRRHRGGVERFFRRPGGTQLQFAVHGEQHDRRAPQAGMDLGDRRLRNVIVGGDARQPAREFVQSPRRRACASRPAAPARGCARPWST